MGTLRKMLKIIYKHTDCWKHFLIPFPILFLLFQSNSWTSSYLLKIVLPRSSSWTWRVNCETHLAHSSACQAKNKRSIFILNRSLLQKWERIEMNPWTLSDFLPSLSFLKNQRFWGPPKKNWVGFGSVGSAVGSTLGICKTSTLRSLCRFLGFSNYRPKWPSLWLEFRPWHFGGFFKNHQNRRRSQVPGRESNFTKKLQWCLESDTIKTPQGRDESEASFNFDAYGKIVPKKYFSQKWWWIFFLVWFVSQQWAQK